MKRSDDPNPLPTTYPCGMKGCGGTVRYVEDDCYRCDTCDFDLTYQDMKDCALFACHLMEQYPDLTPEDIDEMDDEQE
jgi:hypothetical protein